ncbi:hypothetical protein HTZ84_20180 [Haloterrigena sp. SYSU A558-1]|uniref:DUF2892 domain-containing protein n=1 Tax=Haloterrigena gelatinilytica TaxID=2741724 RepID=A0ABX2LLB5_9EURY|nr:hypothetical protein [Haloterrigena gelatinilytica]NUC74586.1 hypothetical protein [Haloterrigena gelatinilytica]
MSEEHDHDLSTELPTEATEKLDEYDVDDPIGAVLSVVGGDLKAAVSLLGGGVALLSALRSLGKGQLRAIPKAAVAAGLLSYGLRNRGGDEAETFQPTLDDIEGGTEGKDVSDAAHAAAERPDSGQESEIDASGDVHESAQLGDEGETGSRIEFSDETDEEETRTKPDHVGDEEDPRRDTDDDETVEVDVSDTAMAEETSEATGPDPEQAQPTQTDATEPEETPEEDASDMKVDPGEEADSTDEDEATEDGDDEDE